MSALPVTLPISQGELIRLTQEFIHWKLVATKAKIVNHHHLMTHFWLTTAVSVQTSWKSQAEYDSDYKAELTQAQDWLARAAKAPDGPARIVNCINAMHKARRMYQETYRDMNAEAAKISADAAEYLYKWGQRPAAIALFSSTVALGWMGLLSGPAVVGLDLAAKSFLISSGEASMAFIGKKIGVGVAASFGTTIAQSWAEAASARFIMVQIGNNIPGYVDDSWRIFFVALNQATYQKVVNNAFFEAAAGANLDSAMKAKGVTVADYERLAAMRKAAAQRQLEAAKSVNTFKAGEPVGKMANVKKLFKVGAWGLTIYQTLESGNTLRTQLKR